MSESNNTSDLNFTVDVLSLVEIYNSKGQKVDTQIVLRILLNDTEDAESNAFTIPLIDLDRFDWVGHDFRCVLPEVNPTKVKRSIANKIRSKLKDVAREKIYITEMGLHSIEDKIVFCTGRKIIRSSFDKSKYPVIKASEIPYSLDYDSSLPKERIITGMLNLASLCHRAGKIILLYNLMWILRAAYAAAWKQPRFCLFGYADTNSLKTAYISLMSHSGGDIPPPQLTSTLAGSVGKIKSKTDCITVFDDLRKNAINRKDLEKLLIDITRGIADETFGTKMNGKEVVQVIPTSGVIFTGEYEFGEGSDAARLLLVEISGVDERKLKFYQSNPLLVGSFYKLFIEWYVSNYHHISERLKKWWYDFYSEIDLGVLRRLRESFYHLSTSHMLLMEFCIENNVISVENAKVYQQSFEELIIDLVREQDKRSRPNEVNEYKSVDHLANIRAMYKNGGFRLADNPKSFTVNYDGFIHENYLCLYSNRINEMIRNSVFGKASLNDVWESVEKQGALKRSSEDKRTTQINCNRKSPRFYKIPLEKLQ